MNKLEKDEWQAWRDIIGFLLSYEIITEEDASAPRTQMDTRGKVLLSFIRKWGDLMMKLGQKQFVEETFPHLITLYKELLEVSVTVDTDTEPGSDPLKDHKEMLEKMESAS